MRKIEKVIFIEPRAPDYHVFSKWGLPRLGCVLLATILRKHGINCVVYVEAGGTEIDLQDVLSADAIGITTITSTAPRAYEIADIAREHGIPVFMGGPHVSFLPEEALEHCDYVIRGEAEDIIYPFIKALEMGEGLEMISGISMRMNGVSYHSPTRCTCYDLDSLPFPDFSLIQGVKRYPITPVMTSRGCPYDCSFCAVTGMFGRRYRFVSPRRVVEGLQSIVPPADPNWVFFYDDIFNAHPKRTKELLRLMISEKVTPHWTAQVRTEVAKDKELLDLMEESNCYACYVGLESINPQTLKAYNKRQTPEDIQECIEKLHEHKIKVHGMFVFGSDEDDVHTIRQTAKFAKKNNIETVQFMILTPLPGSRYYDDLQKQDRLVTREWSLYDAHHVVFEPKKMSIWELQTETFRALLKFYSWWQVIKGFINFDLHNSLLKVYGRRLIVKWRKRNKEFLELLGELTKSAGKMRPTMESFSSRARWLELMAKRAAGDIRVRIAILGSRAREYSRQRSKSDPNHLTHSV